MIGERDSGSVYARYPLSFLHLKNELHLGIYIKTERTYLYVK